jgi:hypothetical protein
VRRSGVGHGSGDADYLFGAAMTSATVSQDSSSGGITLSGSGSFGTPVAGDPAPPPPLDAGDGAVLTAITTTGSVTAVVVSGGLTINLQYDAAAMAAPASFRAGIQQAANLLAAAISDPITVNIKIDYSGTGGWAAAGPDNGLYEDYSTIRADLIGAETPGDTLFNGLPGSASIQGESLVAVWNAQLKALGLLSPTAATDDGVAYFSTDINSNLLVGVALHELTHALGRVPYGSQPDIFDLFRFVLPGTRLFEAGTTTTERAYFSVSDGTLDLADYGLTSDDSDFLNSGLQGSNDPFDEFYSGSTSQQLSAIDLEQLAALGFHLAPNVMTTISATGPVGVVRVGNGYFLYLAGTNQGPVLRLNGAPVAVGQLGAWAPIAATITATGYDVAWKNGSADQYTIWQVDGGGNYVANAIGVVSGSDVQLELYESTFQQDLNGDGTIGLQSTVVEAFGATSLVQGAGTYLLYPSGGSSGPQIRYGGAAVAIGSLGNWAPIAAESRSFGYQVVWRAGTSNQYVVWNLDGFGNYVSDTGVLLGSSYAFESLEPGFQQDLNGDGTIGVPTTQVEASGATKLLQGAGTYLMYPVGGSSGPQIRYGGAPVAIGSLGPWVAIAAESRSFGYQVVWRAGSSNQYTIWNLDGFGNYVWGTGVLLGSSYALESLESSFQQDLNGDGIIGVPTTLIES